MKKFDFVINTGRDTLNMSVVADDKHVAKVIAQSEVVRLAHPKDSVIILLDEEDVINNTVLSCSIRRNTNLADHEDPRD